MDSAVRSAASGRCREAGRIALLAAVAGWLLHPFATNRLIGAGDALWYANMLADFVTQLRAGVFPIFAGQTEFAFNGAVFPLRVAPLYQHLAGALDLLTGRHLGFIALQHLCVIVCGAAGIYAAYFALCDLAPNRRWTAAGLAILYLSCPGLLGTIYTQDLYMTWMTVPFAPLAAYGIVRTFRSDNVTSQAWLAAPLAALWWGHSPIALWFTLLAAASQLVRLALVHRNAGAWKRSLVGAAIFIALAQYPFVSVAELHTPGTGSVIIAGLAHQERITNLIREVFPADLLPLSPHAAALGDLQLGYGLWIVLLGCLVASIRAPRWELTCLMPFCLLLVVLLFPVPEVTDWLWIHLPEEVKRITFYWPMQRFNLILAAVLAVAGQLAGAMVLAGGRSWRNSASVLLALACVWSLWESRQYIRAGSDRTASDAVTARAQRPENILLMNHAYGLFLALPPYFSNGVVDPRSEARLLGRASLRPLPEPEPRLVSSGSFEGAVDANPGILKLSPSFRLEPGRRYRLKFKFAGHDYHGILQVAGNSFFREYVLPSSGEALAFGSGPGNDPALDIWTTNPLGEEITLRFIPLAVGARPEDFAPFGDFRLGVIDPGAEAIEVTSLLPFLASVHAEGPAWLETPRMFMPGYLATVDGRETNVRPSPNGLAMIPVDADSRVVTLTYAGSVSLLISYWAALAAWATLAVVISVQSVRYGFGGGSLRN